MSDLQIIARSVPIIDMEIERGGDGRTVTAYAATFGDAYEVTDQFGHYEEIINRAAFNRQLGRGIGHVQPLFNHGRTISGESSEMFSMPLGVPVSITAEPRGLLTVTRYSKTPLGDMVLELIRDGAIRAQSFRGALYDSRKAGTSAASGLPIMERMALGLKDYGPATFAVNGGAEIMAVRSVDEIASTVGITPEQFAEVQRLLAEVSPHPTPGEAPVDGLETPEPEGQQPGEQPPVPDEFDETLALAQAQRRRRSQL